jgi:hypothetical protein
MSRERDGCCPPRAYEPGSCLIAGMCSSYQTQAQAADLAHKFNRRLGISTSRGDLQVHFLPCVVYTVRRHRDSRSKTSARLVIEETAGWATHPLAACGVATLCPRCRNRNGCLRAGLLTSAAAMVEAAWVEAG